MGEEKGVHLILHVGGTCAAGAGAANGVVRSAGEGGGWICDRDTGGELVDPEAGGAAAGWRVGEVADGEGNAWDVSGGVASTGDESEGGDGGVAGVGEAVAEGHDLADLAGRDGGGDGESAGCDEGGCGEETGF